MKRTIQSICGTLVIHLAAGAFFFFAVWWGAWALNEQQQLGWIAENAGLLVFPGSLAYAAACFGLGRVLMPPEKSGKAFFTAAWPGILIAVCSVISMAGFYCDPFGAPNGLAGTLTNAMFSTPFTFFAASSLSIDTFAAGGIAKLLLYCIGCTLGALVPGFFIWLGGVRKLKKQRGGKAIC